MARGYTLAEVARLLGISRPTLYELLDRSGLRPAPGYGQQGQLGRVLTKRQATSLPQYLKQKRRQSNARNSLASSET